MAKPRGGLSTAECDKHSRSAAGLCGEESTALPARRGGRGRPPVRGEARLPILLKVEVTGRTATMFFETTALEASAHIFDHLRIAAQKHVATLIEGAT